MFGFRPPHQHKRGCAVGDGAGVGCCDRAAFAECGLEVRNFFGRGLERELVVRDLALGFAGSYCERDNFRRKSALGAGFLRAGERGEGECVLRFARKGVTLRAILGERAHQTAFVVGIFQAVEKHVIEHAAVAHAIAGARAIEKIRGVRHALHAAGDDDVGAAGEQKIVGEHHGLHAGAAHFVHRGCAGGKGQTRAQSGLARGSLALAGGKHAAEEDFVDCVGGDRRAFDGCADGGSAELRCGETAEIALECADGGARGAYDHDGVGCGHSCSFDQRGGHAQSAVEADGFAVEHHVLDNVADERGELRGTAETRREGHAFGERVLHFLREGRPSSASRRCRARW